MAQIIDTHTFICAYYANERNKHYMNAYKKNPEGYMVAMEYIRANMF